MDELTDTESIDMSVEDLSPSSPDLSTSSIAAGIATSETLFDDSCSGGSCMDNVQDHSSTSEYFTPSHGSSTPEYFTPPHGSFSVADYVNKFRSCSPGFQHQQTFSLRDVSDNSHSHACSRTISAQHLVEDKQGVHPSRVQMLQEKLSFSETVEANTTSILPLQSSILTKRALSPDLETCKRRKLSPSSSESVENDSESSGSTDASTSSDVRPASVSTPGLIVSNEYVEEFLDDLSDHVQKSVLENLCPDNMRGSFCRTPDVCHRQGSFFACPNYATLRHCRYEEVTSFAHFGYKHTLRGCQVNDKIDCRKRHSDDHPCRARVVYFHVRAACVTLRGGKYCQKEPCEWGHDYEDIRKKVMLPRKRIFSETDT